MQQIMQIALAVFMVRNLTITRRESKGFVRRVTPGTKKAAPRGRQEVMAMKLSQISGPRNSSWHWPQFPAMARIDATYVAASPASAAAFMAVAASRDAVR